MRTYWTVYQCWAYGVVIYVGQTINLPARIQQHSRKPWWVEVNRITTEHYTSRDDALQRERALIRELDPRHNVYLRGEEA